MRRSISAVVLAAALVAGCSGGSAAPSSAALAVTSAPTPIQSPTLAPTVVPNLAPTVVPTVAPKRDWDAEVQAAIASGDCAQLETVGNEANAARELVGFSGPTIAAFHAGTESCDAYGTTTPPAATLTPAPVAYKTLAARNWKLLVKSPDRYAGKGYVIWACISQFDAATGEDMFRGDSSYKNLKGDFWLYGENSAFTGDATRLADFVEDDVVVMNVISTGSYGYDTQAGGNTTVPSFEVKKITRKGSCA